MKKIASTWFNRINWENLLKIISKDQNNFKIELLSAKKNYRKLFKQAEKFKVKNLIITDKKIYKLALHEKSKRVNFYNNLNVLKKFFQIKSIML